MAVIVDVRKSLGPWGWGLCGYDAEGKLQIVVPKDLKVGRGAKWIHRPVTTAEKREVQALAV